MYTYNLAQKFAQIATRYANRIALRYPDGTSLTFQELNVLSDSLAQYLNSQKIKAGEVVAIINEKSPLSYGLMIACIKTGIIYTNLDGSSPAARLSKIIDTCRPSMLFLDEKYTEAFEELQHAHPHIPQRMLKELNLTETGYSSDYSIIHGNHPLYIMFTSGSTGFPKGAVMSHANVLNFIEWGKQTFDVNEDDVFTNANPIYFDNSVFDFYVSIFNGAMLVPLGHDLVKKPGDLVKAINQSGCTIWFSVPSLLVFLLTTKALKADDFPAIRRISFGGEGFPKNKLKQLWDMFGHRISLFNVYGPTECTCICSSYLISESDFQQMNELAPLGYLSPNFGYHILPISDDDSSLGELALTGPCVGLGYYRDEDRTVASFTQVPELPYREIMYKTGDLVQKDEVGMLHFKGRVDNQIKHMGYRIELEEIEAAFASLKYINEAGVIYRKLSAELGFIQAYISINIPIETEAIQADLKGILPAYMLPKKITVMSVLPKNSNGKIDRNQLKQLES